MSGLVKYGILELFFSTLTTDKNYSLRKSKNFPEPIQMLLSKKQNTFSKLVAAFLKFISNFEHFFKKYDLHSRYSLEIRNC